MTVLIVIGVVFLIGLIAEMQKGPAKDPPVMVYGSDGQWHCLNPKQCQPWPPVEANPYDETNPHAL